MPHWKHKLVIRDLHDAYEAKKMTIKKVAEELGKRLLKTPYKEDAELGHIIVRLRYVKSVKDYDRLLKMLYDFGDFDHRLWIESL